MSINSLYQSLNPGSAGSLQFRVATGTPGVISYFDTTVGAVGRNGLTSDWDVEQWNVPSGGFMDPTNLFDVTWNNSRFADPVLGIPLLYMASPSQAFGIFQPGGAGSSYVYRLEDNGPLGTAAGDNGGLTTCMSDGTFANATLGHITTLSLNARISAFSGIDPAWSAITLNLHFNETWQPGYNPTKATVNLDIGIPLTTINYCVAYATNESADGTLLSGTTPHYFAQETCTVAGDPVLNTSTASPSNAMTHLSYNLNTYVVAAVQSLAADGFDTTGMTDLSRWGLYGIYIGNEEINNNIALDFSDLSVTQDTSAPVSAGAITASMADAAASASSGVSASAPHTANTTVAIAQVAERITAANLGLGSNIAWVDNTSGQVAEWTMTSNTVSAWSTMFPGAAWAMIGTANFTGRDSTDILWRNADTGAVVDWQIPNGTGLPASEAGPAVACTLLDDPTWTVVGTGDFNGDGKSDILWRNQTTGDVVEWDMSGFAKVHSSLLLSDRNWNVVGTGDFEGIGGSDILWQNSATGAVVEWNMNRAAHIGTLLLDDPAWTVVGTGDFDGNCKSDILWRNASTGGVVVWMMDGTQPISTAEILCDPNWNVAAVGDYNGDGKSDILWHNASTSQNIDWLMNGTTQIGSAPLGTAGWSPIPSL